MTKQRKTELGLQERIQLLEDAMDTVLERLEIREPEASRSNGMVAMARAFDMLNDEVLANKLSDDQLRTIEGSFKDLGAALELHACS